MKIAAVVVVVSGLIAGDPLVTLSLGVLWLG
jgi:hypothetical protein